MEPMVRFNLNRFDAEGNAALDRALAFTMAGVIEERYPEIKFRRYLPVDTSVPAGARTLIWHNITHFGLAVILASYGDDIPRADAKLHDNVSRIRRIALGFGYDDDEVDEAAFSGVPLPTEKANACRRGHELKHDDIAAKGDADFGLLGLVNQPNVLSVTVPSGGGVGADTTWETKTGAEMLADLEAIAAKPPDATNDVENIDTILLTHDAYRLAVSTMWDDTLSEDTVLQRFKKIHPEITVDKWAKLKGAGTSGADLAIGYRNAPSHVRYIEPLAFTPKSPQEINFEVRVPCKSKSGGVITFFPLSIVKASGI